jgi:hypothetical protein
VKIAKELLFSKIGNVRRLGMVSYLGAFIFLLALQKISVSINCITAMKELITPEQGKNVA